MVKVASLIYHSDIVSGGLPPRDITASCNLSRKTATLITGVANANLHTVEVTGIVYDYDDDVTDSETMSISCPPGVTFAILFHLFILETSVDNT